MKCLFTLVIEFLEFFKLEVSAPLLMKNCNGADNLYRIYMRKSLPRRIAVMYIDGKVILLTGGTGSFGKKFTHTLLETHNPKAVRIFSRG